MDHIHVDRELAAILGGMPPLLRMLGPLLGLLLLLGCSPNTEPAPRSVRLFDDLQAIELRLAPKSSFKRAPLLNQSLLSESEIWRALPWSGLPVQMDQTAPGASRNDKTLELGPEASSWLNIFEVPPDTPLVFGADIEGTGLANKGVSAKLGVLEFSAAPTDEDLAMFSLHASASHFGSAAKDSAGKNAKLFFRTLATTRFIALLALLDTEQSPAFNPNVRVRFKQLRLWKATGQDRLEHCFQSDTPKGRLTHTSIAMTQRRSLGIINGESLRMALPPTAIGDEVHFSLGLLDFESDPLKPPLGSKIDVVCSLQSTMDGSTLVDSFQGSLVVKQSDSARWMDLTLQIPQQDQSIGPLELVVHASATHTPKDTPVLLVAEPYLIPAALSKTAPPRTERRPNVIVISVDTLRADRMSLFGNQRPTTPAMDSFAERCLVFEQAWSNGAYTLPSHMSLFTGQVPSLHGVQGADQRPDPKRSPMLASLLSARGYTTVAFTGGGFVDPSFGFGAGFDSYGTADPMVNTQSARLARDVQNLPGISLELLDDANIDHVNAWLDEHRQEEFLFFLHTYAVHQFDPPARSIDAIGLGEQLAGGLETHTNALDLLFNMGEGGVQQDFEDLVGLYDASVRQADEGVGRFLDKLAELDILEDSIVLIVSDHGKELGEHGKVGHGHTLYEEMVHVPLLLFIGDRARVQRGDFAPGRSAAPVSLVDVLPTLLEALDIAPTSDLNGQSLLHPLPDRKILAEVQNLAVKFALRNGNKKMIWSPLGLDTFIKNELEAERFDLASDPLELHPLPVTASHLARLRATFEAIEVRSSELGSTADGELDEGLRVRLEALGYVEDMRQDDD